jgi:hypothetical protein
MTIEDVVHYGKNATGDAISADQPDNQSMSKVDPFVWTVPKGK